MFGILVLLLIVVPFVELYVILQTSHAIGIPGTIGLLIVVSIVGGWLVKREGLAVFRRARQQMDQRRVPATEIIDGVLILFAGTLLLTPGFITDLIGILLLLPPVRVAMRAAAVVRLRRRVLSR